MNRTRVRSWSRGSKGVRDTGARSRMGPRRIQRWRILGPGPDAGCIRDLPWGQVLGFGFGARSWISGVGSRLWGQVLVQAAFDPGPGPGFRGWGFRSWGQALLGTLGTGAFLGRVLELQPTHEECVASISRSQETLGGARSWIRVEPGSLCSLYRARATVFGVFGARSSEQGIAVPNTGPGPRFRGPGCQGWGQALWVGSWAGGFWALWRRVLRSGCWVVLLMGGVACRQESPDPGAGEVVVYCAQDQVVAEPLLATFTRQTGIRVRAVFDSEAVKTVGLANRLLAERAHPTAEVFWGNEELRTRQLAAAGVFRSPDSWWAFGRRTRCWVVRSGPSGPVVPVDRSGQPFTPPETLIALTNSTWRGRVSMAFPLFGTTATHLLALRQHWGAEGWTAWCGALAANRPFLEEGNSHVVRRVARGEALLGLTDSDDVRAAVREGLPVRALPLGDLSLSMPNTVALVARSDGIRPQAETLVAYLRSPEVESSLVAEGALEPGDGSTPSGLRPDWNRLVAELEEGVQTLERIFSR